MGGVEELEPAGCVWASKQGRNQADPTGPKSLRRKPSLPLAGPAQPARPVAAAWIWEERRSRAGGGAVVEQGPKDYWRPFSWKLTARREYKSSGK